MKKLSNESFVTELSGVGSTRSKQLSRLGITTVNDLIYHFPRAYEKRGNVRLLSHFDEENVASYILTVASEVKSVSIRRGLTISKFRAFDSSGSCQIIFFNSPFVKDVFHIGSEFRFYGKPTMSKQTLQITNPQYEPIIDGVELPDLVPIYPLTDGISSKFICKLIDLALNEIGVEIVDPLPDDIRINNSLPTLAFAIKNLHFPVDEASLSLALKRLAFDEMFCFGLGVSMSAKFKSKGTGIKFAPCDLKAITNLLPYELTNSQKSAINDIYKDVVIGDSHGNVSPMARIIVGDVGSGKTICAIMAIFMAASSGYQSALMAPTEILARQHYNDIAKLLSGIGLRVELLIGSLTPSEKRRVQNSIKNGEVDVVVGTHALISDNVSFARLGLVITDEQHRFGIEQRANLRDKGQAAHLLVMSATPIPRTLALTMYGDLDITRITEMPKGRVKIDTFVVNEGYRERLNTFISKQVKNGGQCYIVCPAIERTEEEENSYSPISISELSLSKNVFSNLKNATEYAETLRQKLPELRIECLHGKIKPSEKDDIMSRFSDGHIDVLVSTTVIEVGINVPNASLIIIENADRFGLSQLHQLRGRVGRGTRKSYCVLVSDSSTEKAKARLEVIRSTYDGYEIAEKDLLLRGPGDFFASTNSGMRQSGGFEFKFAKLCDDDKLFEAAFSSAKRIIECDPELALEEHLLLKEKLGAFITHTASTIS